jgi:hypothetical protein
MPVSLDLAAKCPVISTGILARVRLLHKFLAVR